MIRMTMRLALLATLSGPALGGPPTAVIDLGEEILPQAISDNGAVVVGHDIGRKSPGVFRWTAKQGTHTIGGELLGRPGVSADGRTIAATVLAEGIEAAFWTEQGGWVPLSASGLIPALPGWNTMSETISSNGKRLAGATIPAPVEYRWERAFSFNPDTWTDRWADFGWRELPRVGKGGLAWASGISDDGRVQVGSASERNSWFLAARWVDGQVKFLQDANGERLGGEVVKCNSNCTVIVGGGGGSSTQQPVLAWRLDSNQRAPACHFQPLDPSLQSLRYYSHGLSDSGNVVIGAYYYDVLDDSGMSRNFARGFIWLAERHGGTLFDVQEYLAARGQPYLSKWQDVVPTEVSADGRYLIGWGADAKGTLRGWRIDLWGVGQATAGQARARYTRCPTHTNKDTPAVADEATTTEWARPQGTFRSADGRQYQLKSQGALLYAGPSEDQLQELLPLGGDQYYDKRAYERLWIVRDAAGAVSAIRTQQQAMSRIYHRQGS